MKREKEKILFPEQQSALNTLMQGLNVFLSGEAGTGKSTVLNKFRSEAAKAGKKVAVVAPTGIAAINVGGATVHRTFQAEVGPILSQPKKISPDLLEVDIFIIEEISMCRVDLFDWTAFCIFKIYQKRAQSNKHTQIVVCGDFFQLPPVLKKDEAETLSSKYPSLGSTNKRSKGYGFAFTSQYWNNFNFIYICLTQVIRQKDVEFVENLNKARIGDASCLPYFMEASVHEEISGAVYLSGRNREVSDINNTKLNEMKRGKIYSYVAEQTGTVLPSDKVTEDYLVLTEGARVMTLINDSDDLYRNGSMGTVVKCTTLRDTNRVIVKLDNGPEVAIEPHTWEIARYAVNLGKFEKTVVGTFTQLPLKLAYAVTIHKSQGQTYDKVNLNPDCWDVGQLYVALSRVRTIEGLHFTQPLQSRYLKASEEVKAFYSSHGMKF